MKVRRRWGLLSGGLAVGLFLSRPASADTVAESLYEVGVELLKKRDFEAACPKLQASFDREPLSGSLMTLAQCHDLQGKTATAWEEYKRAATLATNEKRPAYQKRAEELAEAMRPKLTKLMLETAEQSDGFRVTLAGEDIDPATFGVAVALDPGVYEVEASAPGYEAWSTSVTLEGAGEVITLTIPTLRPAPSAPSPSPSPAPSATSDEGGVPLWAWIAGGVGIAAATGSFIGLGVQLDAASDLDEACGAARDDCPSADVYDFEGDHRREKLGNGVFIGLGVTAIVGLGVGVTGLAMGLSGGDDTAALPLEVTPWLGPNIGGLGVSGRF